MQRDVLEQGTEVAECIAREHVVEIGGCIRQIEQRANLRDDKDFGKRKSHALP